MRPVLLPVLLTTLAAQADPPPPCRPDDATQARIELSVEGLRSARGQITLSLYPDDADAFLAKGGKIAKLSFPAAQPIASTCFGLPAPGHYALSIYHDENGNGRLDKNFIGKPTEGGGFSNNPKVTLLPPSFKEARFDAPAGSTAMTVRVRY